MAAQVRRKRYNHDRSRRVSPQGTLNLLESHSAAQAFHCREHMLRILQNLNSFRTQAKLCDVEILVGGELFYAHRAVLAASSHYFEAMFSSGLVEGQQRTIEIHDVQPITFSMLIGFIYTGALEINHENVQDLLSASNMLELSEVVAACCDFLQKELHPTNCVGIYRFAELHSCINLRLEAKRFTERHFSEVIQEDEFYDLPKDTLKNFLKSEGLSIDGEFEVFQATMKWILHNVTLRRKYVFEVLESVRLPVISQKQLDLFVSECPDLSLKVALMKLLQEHKTEMKLLQLERRLGQVYDIRLQPRMCARKSVYVIGGYNRDLGRRWADSQSLVAVERLDTFRGQWKSLPPMHHARSGHGVVVLNSLVYALGGESDCMIFDNGEMFDPVTNQWTMVACMKQPRCVLGACAIDDSLYVLGGWVGAEIGSTVERYDPASDTWSPAGRMNVPRYAMGVTSHQGLIYVVGGLSDLSAELDLVENYNPVTGEWLKLAPLRTRRAYVGLAVLHDHMYAVGGTNNYHAALRSAERYSLEDNKWTDIPPMRTARAGASVVVVNGKLMVIGGRTSSNEFSAPVTLDTIEVYDPETNTWSESTPMPTGRCEAGAVVL